LAQRRTKCGTWGIGGINGKEVIILKKCEGKVETYSRVCGFMRPVQTWNPGKKAEFKERKEFKSLTKKPVAP
jgi:ribonucleoside-triphosphate reductase